MDTVSAIGRAGPRSYGIGDTPIVPIRLRAGGRDRRVYLKLEGKNPAGSIKDRTAYALITALEDQGVLRPGCTVVESSSGNLGVALAFICAKRGYGFTVVVDPKATPENVARMEKLGAHIEVVQDCDETGNYLMSRIRRAEQLCGERERCVWTSQYTNPANPLAHYAGTGPEIMNQMDGAAGAIFVAAGTGGTLAGIGRYLREHAPATKLIGVDAVGSVIFGAPPAPRKLVGIGSARTSAFLTPDLFDEAIHVTDAEAFACCRALLAVTELWIGGSSGAVVAACARYLERHPFAERVVCLCPDNGENYRSTIFDDAWLDQHALRDAALERYYARILAPPGGAQDDA